MHRGYALTTAAVLMLAALFTRSSRLTSPLLGLALDPDGDLFVADNPSNRVWKVSPSGLLTTFAGNGKAAFAGDGGPAVKASLNLPVGVAVDPSGAVFIVDYNNQRV